MGASSSSRIWIVVPVYFDHECFVQLKQHVRTALGAAARGITFLVVDDSAGSDRALEAESKDPDVVTLAPPFNLGHQRALVFGLRRMADQIGPQDLVVTMDSDGEDRPEDLPRMLSVFDTEQGRDKTLVLARRTTRHVPTVFRVMHFFFAAGFRLLTGTLIRTGNFAAFRGSLLKQILFHPHFDLCYSSSLLSLNLDVRFVPCARGRRYAGRSKMNYLRLMAHGVSMFMPFLDRVAIRMLLFLGAAVAVSLLALLVLGIQSLLNPGAPVFSQMWPFVAIAGMCLVSMPLSLLLFASYAQARGAALAGIERSAQ